ncbi:MAG: hypothetical protein V1809_05855 [Planctomycetota bacterium]
MMKFKGRYIFVIFLLAMLVLPTASCITVNMPATKDSSTTPPSGGQEQPPVVTPPVTKIPPTISYFTANPGAITQGSSATLTWSVQGATSVTIDQGIGSVGLTGSRTASPLVSTIYTLIATSDAGNVPATVQVTVTAAPVIPPPVVMELPTIYYFSASPTSILSGNSATLTWSVANASSVVISGIGAVGPSGSYTVSPTATTAYTLTATNPAGWRSMNVAVTVTYLINPNLFKKLPWL